LIEEAKTSATYDDTAIKALIQSNTDAIGILNGDATTVGSIKHELAAIVGTAPEALNTLEEIAAWI
jgi:hypothetical protein